MDQFNEGVNYCLGKIQILRDGLLMNLQEESEKPNPDKVIGELYYVVIATLDILTKEIKRKE